MLKIIITTDTNPQVRKTNAGDMYKQTAWVHLEGSAFPKEIQVTQWPNRDTGEIPEFYKQGEYTFGADSFSVQGKYNDLVCNPKLIPLVAKTAKSSS